MFTNKAADGKNNLCADAVFSARKELKLSQRQLAERMQLFGIDLDKNAIQRIEAGKRFVTDIELAVLSKVLGKTLDELLKR